MLNEPTLCENSALAHFVLKPSLCCCCFFPIFVTGIFSLWATCPRSNSRQTILMLSINRIFPTGVCGDKNSILFFLCVCVCLFVFYLREGSIEFTVTRWARIYLQINAYTTSCLLDLYIEEMSLPVVEFKQKHSGDGRGSVGSSPKSK